MKNKLVTSRRFTNPVIISFCYLMYIKSNSQPNERMNINTLCTNSLFPPNFDYSKSLLSLTSLSSNSREKPMTNLLIPNIM